LRTWVTKKINVFLFIIVFKWRKNDVFIEAIMKFELFVGDVFVRHHPSFIAASIVPRMSSLLRMRIRIVCFFVSLGKWD